MAWPSASAAGIQGHCTKTVPLTAGLGGAVVVTAVPRVPHSSRRILITRKKAGLSTLATLAGQLAAGCRDMAAVPSQLLSGQRDAALAGPRPGARPRETLYAAGLVLCLVG